MSPTLTLTCGSCQKVFKCNSALLQHKRTHTGEKPYVCDLCPKSFKQRSNLERHRRSHTGEKPFSCEACDKSYASRVALNRHLRIHTGEKPFSCNFCNRRFHGENVLYAHRKSCDLDPASKLRERKICDVCKRSFKNANSLCCHKSTRHNDGPRAYPCDECGKTFGHHSLLRQHQNVHSKVRLEKCSFCSWTFKYPSALSTHIKAKHTDERPFPCPASNCGFRFSTKGNMEAHHKRIHLGMKHHTCPLCPKQFAENSELTKHLPTHTGERSFACDACDKKFAKKCGLNRHVMVHLGEKPHVCSQCGKRYKYSEGLRHHILVVHNPVRVQPEKRQCGVCQKFVTSNHLREHERIHNRDKFERPFPCHVCSKTFYTNGELKAHVARHDPEIKFCSFCDKSFRSKPGLESHLRKHLGETTAPDYA